MQLLFSTSHLDLSTPRVMGILNVTPDSFSDGGRYADIAAAIDQAKRMVDEGADIIDIGGESTRPGAKPVSKQQELDRIIPVIEALRGNNEVPISIDTSKPHVMEAAIAAGANMINDVAALRAPGALETAAQAGCPVCLMHMQGEPRTMQENPQYSDVVEDVAAFLRQRADVCVAAGISKENIILDPGFGFGKTLEHNLSLLKHLDRLVDTGYPVLAGISRKRMIGTLLGDADVEARLQGSVAAAVIAAIKGASILRVHDVRETVEALAVATAVITQG